MLQLSVFAFQFESTFGLFTTAVDVQSQVDRFRKSANGWQHMIELAFAPVLLMYFAEP